MNNSPAVSRRQLLALAVASVFAFTSCASNPTRSGPIAIDITGVNDIRDLIRSIRKAGADQFSHSSSDDEFFKVIAKSFVENVRAVSDRHGIKVPSWIMDRLPNPNVAWSNPDELDTLVFITILGIVFVLPQLLLVTVVLSSVLLMTNYIADELRKRLANRI